MLISPSLICLLQFEALRKKKAKENKQQQNKFQFVRNLVNIYQLQIIITNSKISHWMHLCESINETICYIHLNQRFVKCLEGVRHNSKLGDNMSLIEKCWDIIGLKICLQSHDMLLKFKMIHKLTMIWVNSPNGLFCESWLHNQETKSNGLKLGP